MKKIVVLLLATVFCIGTTKADEGMWLPLLIKRLNHVDMQKHGLQLTAEEIYSVNNSSLKDAIVALDGRFCTGEIISKEGLMLTNHHCGYDAIQKHSTTDHDYLTDGFWAMEKSQELPVGFTVWFLDRMDDVTQVVLNGVTDEMAAGERQAKIRENVQSIIAKEKEGKGEYYEVHIKSFFYGNEYYMFKYNIYPDVRLVGTPPESIGKFGGDTDNWMWPRHTGDFSMFRVYADKDNNPAPYSTENKPLTPKHHLPISMDGVAEGDYAMILGYPGSTDRFLTSYGVKRAVEIEQPTRVEIRRAKLDIMEEGMEKDQKIRIQYASKHAGVSNYWKYFLGQSTQLVKNKVYDKKKTIEDEFLTWAHQNRGTWAKYGKCLEMVSDAYTSNDKYIIPQVYMGEAIFQGPEILEFIMNNFGFRSDMTAALADNDVAKIEAARKEILAHSGEYFKDYNQEIDQKLLGTMLTMFHKNVDKAFHPAELTAINLKYKGDFHKFAEKYFAKSGLVSQAALEAYLPKFNQKIKDKDPLMKMMDQFIEIYIQQILTPQRLADEKMNTGMRLFVDGLLKMNPDKAYASDANSTMRVTYGNVLSYDAKDGVHYKHFTTLEGVLEKMVIDSIVKNGKKVVNKNHEFYVPDRLVDLYNKKDYGQYKMKDGNLPVGFLSNNDITGGNSGSPVINGKGQLIGTAFDGNWEAMSGDIYFEPNIQRTISVDIRYTLFIIDKYAGAGHLVKEMTLVKTPEVQPLPAKEVATPETEPAAN